MGYDPSIGRILPLIFGVLSIPALSYLSFQINNNLHLTQKYYHRISLEVHVNIGYHSLRKSECGHICQRHSVIIIYYLRTQKVSNSIGFKLHP